MRLPQFIFALPLLQSATPPPTAADMKLPSLARSAVAAALPYLTERACLSCSSPCSKDACETNTPGGLLLLTTFWDYSPATGPDDSFTMHGLWPDTCSGGYDSDCDSSRNVDDIAGALKSAGADDTLDYMNQYWLDVNGDNNQFWSHEWNKHGTCVSTLAPKCYGSDFSTNEDLADYFTTAVDLFKGLNLYKAFAAKGITPSTSKTYTKSQLQSAAKAAFGYTPAFRCRSGKLTEAWHFHETSGRSTSASAFTRVAPTSGSDNCPSSGISWVPKS